MTRPRHTEERDQRIRVVLLVPVLDFGGIETRTVLQASHSSGTRIDLKVCCFEDAGRAARAIRACGITVDELGTTPSVRNPSALYRLIRYLHRTDVDVLHTVTGAMTVHGMLAGRIAGVPVRIAEEVGIPRRGKLGQRLFPYLYRQASCVIGVSDAVIEHIVAEDGVPPDKARRVYNAIEPRYFEQPVRRRLDETFEILTAGRLDPLKGHADLVNALAPWLRDSADVRLRIAGDGAERSSLGSLIADLGIADQVELMGYRSDLPELLAETDLFVLPSRSEGFGLAVVEAMAARVPVVATRVGGVPEVFPEWAADWLVPPSDPTSLRLAVQRVRAMPRREREQLGARLHAHAKEHFAVEAYVAEIEALYSELLSRSHWGNG